MRNRKHGILLLAGALVLAVAMLGAGLALASDPKPLVRPADATLTGSGRIPASSITTCTGRDGDTYQQETIIAHGTQTSGLAGTPSGKFRASFPGAITDTTPGHTDSGALRAAGTYVLRNSSTNAIIVKGSIVLVGQTNVATGDTVLRGLINAPFYNRRHRPTARRLLANVEVKAPSTGTNKFSVTGDFGAPATPKKPGVKDLSVIWNGHTCTT